jgi:hypothetical protein
MIKFAFLSVACTLSGLGQEAAPDPCWFVAIQTLKVTSTCDLSTGTCRNLGIHTEDERLIITTMEGPMVSCDEAGELGTEILLHFYDQTEPSYFPVLETLEAVIIPSLRRAIYSHRSGNGADEAMRQIVKYLAQVFVSLSEDTSPDQIIDGIKSSQIFLDFFNLIHEFVMSTVLVPFQTARPRIEATQRYIQFAFDLFSFIPVTAIDGGTELIEILVQYILPGDNSNLYRSREDWEFGGIYSGESVLENPGEAIVLSESIDWISGIRDGGSVDHIRRFLYEMGNQNSAAAAIVMSHIKSAFCSEFIANIQSCLRSNLPYQMVSSLIVICRPEMADGSRDDLLFPSMQMRDMIDQGISERFPTNKVIHDGSHEMFAQLLTEPELIWPKSFTYHITNLGLFFENVVKSLHVLTRFEGVLIFRRAAEFPSRGSFEKSMTAFGRLVGMYAFMEYRIGGFLGIPDPLFRSIHTLQGDEELLTCLGTLMIIDECDILNDFVYEPIFFIQNGIRDALGPVGIEVYTLEDWSDIFQMNSPLV